MSWTKAAPDVFPIRQILKTECWLSCLIMMFQWKRNKGDTSKNPDEICRLIDRSPNLWSDYMVKNGIAPGECRETARQLGLRAAGDGEIYPEFLADVLRKHGPLWIAGRWYQDCDHVMVVTACNPELDKVRVLNPWNNFSGEETEGTMRWLNARGSVWKNCDASIMYWS